MRPTRISFAALGLLLSAGFASHVATHAWAAGEISQDALNADRSACLSSCSAKGGSETGCASYCSCAVKGIGDQLSLEEYRGLSEAANEKKPAPQPALDKLKTITNGCRVQMQQ